jgi:hypothetical protein
LRVRAMGGDGEKERERERERERKKIGDCSLLCWWAAHLLLVYGLNQNRAGPLVSHSLRFFSSFLLPAHPLVAPAQQGRDGAQRRRLLIARSPAASSTSTASALPQDLEDYAPAHDADADPIPFPKWMALYGRILRDCYYKFRTQQYYNEQCKSNYKKWHAKQ